METNAKATWFGYVQDYDKTKEYCMSQLKHLLTAAYEVISSPQYTFHQFLRALELSNGLNFDQSFSPVMDICLRQLIRQSPLQLVQLVLDYSIHLASISIIDDSTPLLLLEDVMERSPFEECKSILFNILEDRMKVLLAGMIPNKGKALVILRICNELLKRASKTIDGPFCGRIVFFLSKTFSLTERSAVNLKGHFNIDNTTHIDPPQYGEESLDFKALLRVDIPSVQLGYDLKTILKDLNDVKSPISYLFYQTFWYFQTFCTNPSSMLSSNAHWSLFSSIIVDIVFLVEYCVSQLPERQLIGHNSTVKLLSSRQLLKYQLRDQMFLYQLLVQILIVFGHLDHQLGGMDQNENLKTKIDFTNHGKERCLSLLGFFNLSCPSTIKMLLKEEGEWIHWKNEGCNPFEQKPIDVAFEYVPRSIMMSFEDSPIVQQDKDIKELLLNRVYEPKLMDYISPFKEQLDPGEQIEEEYRLDRDPVYVWKVLRLASRQNPLSIIEAYKKVTEGDELIQLVNILSSQNVANAESHQTPSLTSLKQD